MAYMTSFIPILIYVHALIVLSYFLNKNVDILKQKTMDVEVKKYCVSIMEEMGSFEYTRQVLSDLKNEIRAEIKELGGNFFLEQTSEILFRLG